MKPRARPPPRRSACSRRRATRWRARAPVRARACAGKSASSPSRAHRACSSARSIRRPTRSCWISSPPRSPVAERATIARPYAKAAFEYARAANALAPWSQGLKSRRRDRRRSARCGSSSTIRAGRRRTSPASSSMWRGAKLDAAMQNFVRVLAENHRLAAAAGDRGALRGARARRWRIPSTSRSSPPWRSMPRKPRSSSRRSIRRLQPPGAHAEFRRRVAPGRRGDSRRGSRHRRLAQGSPGAARNRIGKLNI